MLQCTFCKDACLYTCNNKMVSELPMRMQIIFCKLWQEFLLRSLGELELKILLNLMSVSLLRLGKTAKYYT